MLSFAVTRSEYYPYKDYGTHSLRKTFSDHRYKAGIPLGVIQKLLNHSNSITTLSYIGMTNEEMQETFTIINL